LPSGSGDDKAAVVGLYSLLKPAIFALDAETAHRATIQALRLMPRRTAEFAPSLRSEVAGLSFPSPVGLGAGFDKDAEAFDQALSLGFGFVEVGTLTPRPQQGNAKPRLFRLPAEQGVINRMGFNNHGQQAALARLSKRDRARGIVGVNIGANKDSADRIGDYVDGVRAMSAVADYLTVNISSPNTPGLRALQGGRALDSLLGAVAEARGRKGPPLFLKVAPDLAPGDAKRIVGSAIDHKVDALIVANTTVSRPRLSSPSAGEHGGLSGAPLRALALDALRQFRSASGGAIPLIGCGGIATAEDAWERIRAGASLVQLYTAMVYAGPGVARRIAEGLERKLAEAGFGGIAEAVGSE
jgi:dihydroorotate dehydrogenase